MIHNETMGAIKGIIFLVLVMQNPSLFLSWGMILLIINNKGVVAKIPNHPKAFSINQGKNGMAEENINKFSTKRNNCIRDNFIWNCCILLHLREMNKTKMGHIISMTHFHT
ncbi:hypothetical protein [Bacillus toyonensis]|uniref:hypothetical protein n=1 Tax=Bacillus toyonensis TaxID=155322 RepID=UPI0025406A16|nr:hypothetical protein [Bacillus toyonensis]WIG34043.1 hypothetical protein QPL83_00900 [Bacillus toyonensis]